MKNKNNDIVKGYKGIMDLDLSFYNKEQQKVAVDQHYKDIYEYKKYQNELEPRLRYENTIEKVREIHYKDRLATIKRNNEEEEEKLKRIVEIEKYFKTLQL